MVDKFKNSDYHTIKSIKEKVWFPKKDDTK